MKNSNPPFFQVLRFDAFVRYTIENDPNRLCNANCHTFALSISVGFFGRNWWQLLGDSITGTRNLHGLSLDSAGVSTTPGPEGLNAWDFLGTQTSYVRITNDGTLNFGSSGWTIGTFFYQDNLQDGPIIEWRGKGSYGTHLWIYRNQLFLNLVPVGKSASSSFEAPMTGMWHFVGASYNAETGDFFMWIDEKLFQKNLGKLTTDMNGDVYVGIRPSNPASHPLKARLAGMTLLKGAITPEEISTFKAEVIRFGKVATPTIVPGTPSGRPLPVFFP